MAVTKSITKACLVCGESKPLSDYTKKERGILGVRPQCNKCRSAARKLRYDTDREYRIRQQAYCLKSTRKNPEANRLRVKEWVRANPEKRLLAKRAWEINNKEKVVDSKKKWSRNNAHKVNAATARRAATKINATPVFANKFFIEEAYSLARLRTKVTGIKWEVDHIVPLRSKKVCGLHAESNIRVIEKRINGLKANRYWPDMP